MKKLKIISAFLALCLFVLTFSGCGSQKDELSVAVITDPHFAGKANHSYEGTYLAMNDTNGSGKQMRYLDDIVDAFISQMQTEKPDFVIITGDLSFIGAKASHIEFAERLSALKESGIVVLVVPGNHDIVSSAAIFPDGEALETEPMDAESFPEVYFDFGYGDALSYDESSFSYVYDTGKGVRIFMLDTNFMHGAIFGKLSEETMAWLKNELAACAEAGDVPLVAGHHNLLVHNKLFNFGYTIGNADEVKELFAEYGAKLYLSGHIHTQHIASDENITDIVTESFALYPHRYGFITFDNESGFAYESRTTNVAGHAEKAGLSDENLLNYNEYGFNFFYNNAFNQAKGNLADLITDEAKLDAFAKMSAEANVYYFGGNLSQLDASLLNEFYEISTGTRWGEYINIILEDLDDQLSWAQNEE